MQRTFTSHPCLLTCECRPLAAHSAAPTQTHTHNSAAPTVLDVCRWQHGTASTLADSVVNWLHLLGHAAPCHWVCTNQACAVYAAAQHLIQRLMQCCVCVSSSNTALCLLPYQLLSRMQHTGRPGLIAAQPVACTGACGLLGCWVRVRLRAPFSVRGADPKPRRVFVVPTGRISQSGFSSTTRRLTAAALGHAKCVNCCTPAQQQQQHSESLPSKTGLHPGVNVQSCAYVYDKQHQHFRRG
jgi:hypothetical protein